MSDYTQQTLPISITNDSINVDESFLTITHSKAFLTRNLRSYYLSTSSVYQKVVYKSFWIEEKFDGPLTRNDMKLKVTTVFPDVVGIEFAKTKTICSKSHPRMLEVLQGNGMILLQSPTEINGEEGSTYVIRVKQGDKSVIPPNWFYTLVNTSQEVFATAELYKKSQSLNNCHCTKKGSSVFVIERNGIAEIVKNSQYKNMTKYATVDPNIYAEKISVTTSDSLVSQIDKILNSIDNLDHVMWLDHLETTGGKVFLF